MAIGDIQLTSAAMPATPARDAQARVGVLMGEKPDAAATAESLDELKNEALPTLQVEVFLREIRNQPSWRREADRAVDYYDGNQLSPETVERLRDRGQPPLITNIIKPTIDTVLGIEAKTRTDWRVRPDDDDECSDDVAEALSIKLKHAETESRADRAVSDAYAAQIKAGLGWVEVAREHDPFKPPYRVKYIHRREISWDWRSEQPDISDARYLVRRRWLELEHSIALMPGYADLFRNTTGGWAGFDPVTEQDTGLVQSWEVERDTHIATSDWRDIERQRVCLYEIWYRKWVRGKVLTLTNGTSFEYDENNPRHNQAIVAGIVTVKAATFQKVRLAWYCGPHFLYDVPSPYKHNQFPYVPFFGYREDLTGVPYGCVRPMISPQDEINARKSKMLWLMNSRRVLADSDAVLDHDRAAEEVARADAYIQLNAARKPGSKFEVTQGGELALQQFQVMQEAKQEIAEASGIHKSMQGQNSNASSGLAINSLIEQGLSTLAEINDNYRYSRRLVGEMLFDLMRQSLIAKGPSKVVIGEGQAKKVILLNAPGVDPDTGQPCIVNDISKIKASIVLDDVPSTPTYKMQQLQMLTEITKALPEQLQAAIVHFMVEATDLPKRHEIADALRAASGIKGPDEQKAQAEAMQAQQAEAAQLAKAEQEAKIAKLNADARLTDAQAAKTAAEAGQGDGAAGQISSMQADFAAREAALQRQSDDALRPLQDEIVMLQMKLADKGHDIAEKYATELEKARIEAQAAVDAARAGNASEQALEPILAAIKNLETELATVRADVAAREKLLQKDIAQAAKDAKAAAVPAAAPPAPAAPKDDAGMAQVLATLAQTQAMLATVMAAPRSTKIVEDAKGRAVGATSTITPKD